jgi:hypothetical protein
LPCYLLALALALVWLPALAQDPDYHRFADDRSWLGIPNFADVMSNLAILLAALWALGVIRGAAAPSERFRTVREYQFALICFVALALTAFGSAWYHLAPDNARLFWDRLPLGLAFTSVPALLIAERVSLTRMDAAMLMLWVLVGPASVLYWHLGELAGQGDLRPYFLLHVFMFLLPPLLIALPSPYTHRRSYLAAYLLFVVAMVCDWLDDRIFQIASGLISGHTFKHLFMGLAIAVLAHMFAIRRRRQR